MLCGVSVLDWGQDILQTPEVKSWWNGATYTPIQKDRWAYTILRHFFQDYKLWEQKWSVLLAALDWEQFQQIESPDWSWLIEAHQSPRFRRGNTPEHVFLNQTCNRRPDSYPRYLENRLKINSFKRREKQWETSVWLQLSSWWTGNIGHQP